MDLSGAAMMPYPTTPGAALTWEQALARLGDGQKVETPDFESRPEGPWIDAGSLLSGMCSDWTYRVPL